MKFPLLKNQKKKEFTIHSDTSFAMGKQAQNVQSNTIDKTSSLPFSINQGTKYSQQQQTSQQVGLNKSNTSQNNNNQNNQNKNTTQQTTKKIDQTVQPIVPSEGFSPYNQVPHGGYPMYPPPMYFYPPQGQNYDPNSVNPNYPMMPFYYMPQNYGMQPTQTPQEDESSKNKKFGGYSQNQPQYSQPLQGGQPTEIPNTQVPGQFPHFAPYMYYNNQNPYQMGVHPSVGQGMNLGNPQQLENQGYNTGNYDNKKNTGNDDSQSQNFYNYSYFKQQP